MNEPSACTHLLDYLLKLFIYFESLESHRLRMFHILSTRSEVEYPSLKGRLITRPPAASTSARPTIWSTFQSPPLTRISGSKIDIIRSGVGSSKIVRKST